MESDEFRIKPPDWPPEAVAAGLRRLRVLACDDERHIVRLIQVNLERQGCLVTTAFDGRECLAKLAIEVPDLLILDTYMPFLDGFEVVRRLRAEERTRDLPVILLGASVKGRGQVEEIESGVLWVLSKPFNPMSLWDFLRWR